MDSGDTAWMLASSALVLLMAPGLAFFYGGMVRAKSVLNMMMMTFIAMAIVPVVWFLYGYSLTFDDDAKWGLIGKLGLVGLRGITPSSLTGTIPTYVFVIFQLTFAIVTVALISGTVADRMKFSAWALFVPVWLTVVYFPVAHWVFAFDGDGTKGGWIANSLGAGLLWFGWIGLVAITPACGSVSPLGSLVVGLIAGSVCAFAIGLKYKLGYDDSLDVVGVHLVGGMVGTLLIGLLATGTAVAALGFGRAGLLYGGGLEQLAKQAVAVVVVLAYAVVCTCIIGTVIDKMIGLRVSEEDEVTGIDQIEHLETAYDHVGSAGASHLLTGA